ncbi:amino acid ABC transporter substrate-binding protein [Pedobacter changchengzhani]|uniref:Amino acid ABC transporter substrate-binding protein n=1 Tax=Pedobacter changchengzhani TaxID=2529274 RepID=A0A4R5MIG1_9SPHI|nr:ABC transporter substrate-binding protein [Pedobacter changchengzhani]TDG35126.1 amino acid ABC transporter substrate-binding protein [Pedobacter changchengzhani]
MNFKNIYWVFVLFILVLSACSPKVLTPKKPSTPTPVEKEKPAEKVKKPFTKAEISLLIPFKLDQLDLRTVTKAQIEKYAMPIDFYQGFSLGLDSAAVNGMNFKLNVYDTEDNNAQIESANKTDWLKNSNLIIGPVFPDGIKYISKFSKAHHIPVVSPLAASHPGDFDNPNLISIVNNIDLHAKRIAHFIGKSYNPVNTIVVILNPKKTEDEQFAVPLRSFLNGLKAKFMIQEYSSSNIFETKMIKGKQYVVVVTSSDRVFVNATINKLYKLKNLKTGGYNISLFGHPNWAKQNLPTEKLQALNTIITSSYKIDYKRTDVVNFIKKYRLKFGFEPGEYAFKGYDIGFYFGDLFARYGRDYLDHLTRSNYIGLHNDFVFVKDDKLGYINTHVFLLRYKNFALSTVD